MLESETRLMKGVIMANRRAIIETNKGTITAELYEDKAPITSANFIDLIERGFYDGLKFHRYEPGFVIQGGDPRGNGTGDFTDPQTGRKRTIQLEVTPELKHGEAGALAMARSNDPNSASCQFYITLGPAAFLDMNYAVFGRVTDGLDVVKQLRAGDAKKSVSLSNYFASQSHFQHDSAGYPGRAHLLENFVHLLELACFYLTFQPT